MIDSSSKSRGPIIRVTAEDFIVAKAALEKVSLGIVPDNQSQRKVFAHLMPNIFVLRRKGCSFIQIAGLLAQCNINLQPSTVSRYYAEMLAERMDVCEQQMETQIGVLHELKKQSKGVDLSAVAGMVDAAITRQQAQIDAKVDSLLGGRSLQSHAAAPQSRQVTSSPAPVQSASVVRDERSAEKPNTPIAASGASGSPGRSGAAPSLAKTQATPKDQGADQKSQPRYKCGTLKSGIAKLKPRAGVPAEVYKEGELDHPAIPNLPLTLEQRLYGTCLEVIDVDDGTVRLETMEEKRFRVVWRKPVPQTPSRTMGDFTPMNLALFPKRTPASS